MKYKKLTALLLGLCIIYIVLLSARMWYVDPLHLFHKPYVCQDSIFSNMRFSNAGIIKKYEFDNIILGSSMLENTSAKEASDVFGGKFFNLSMSGSSFYERSIVLDYAFRHKKINKIIYSLDASLLIFEIIRDNKTRYHPELYSFLYDDNSLNDFKAYANNKFLKEVFKFECTKTDIDRPTAWYNGRAQQIFGSFDNWIKYPKLVEQDLPEIIKAVDNIKNNNIQQPADLTEEINNAKKYIDDYLLSFVKQHPETEFYVFMPPYSRIQNAIQAKTQYNDFIFTKESLRHVVKASSQYKNLKIYAWGNSDYPDDIGNFSDLYHYSEKFNSLMLYYMAENKGLLTPDNFDAYYDEFEKKSLAFDLMPYYEQIQNAFAK